MTRYGFDGPLYTIFRNQMARVLDQAAIVGNMEQTVSILSESTSIDKEGLQDILSVLLQHRLIRKGRKIGNQQTYRFNVEKELRSLIIWMDEFQVNELTPK